MVAPAAEPDPADAADAEGLRCVRCGYLLTGLPEDGACPECGTPVASSAARVDLLRDQDPAWLGRLAEGLLWQIASSVVWLASAVVAWTEPEESATQPHRFPLATALHLLTLLLNAVAAWWITTPEPRVSEPVLSLRRCARVVGVLTPLTLAVAPYVTYSSTAAWAASTFLWAILPLADVVLWYAYVHRLALRLPSAGLAFQCLLLLCGFGITEFFTHALPWVTTVLGADTLAEVAYGFGGWPAYVVSLALGVYAPYVFFRLRAGILRARDEAAASGPAEAPSRGAD